MKYIDTHAHPGAMRFNGPFRTWDGREWTGREELFKAMWKEGIATVAVGTDIGTFPDAIGNNAENLRLAKRYLGLFYAAVGLHPGHVLSAGAGSVQEFRRLAALPGVVGLGETGFDFHCLEKQWHTYRGVDEPFMPLQEQYVKHIQRKWFRLHMEIAQERDLPVILHVRSGDDSEEADREALKILAEYPQVRGTVHAFLKGPETAKQYIAAGFLLGIGAGIMYPGAEEARETVRQIPLQNILLETDSPFMVPQKEGKRYRRSLNTPLSLPAIAAYVGKLKGISAEEIRKATKRNAASLFRLPGKEEG